MLQVALAVSWGHSTCSLLHWVQGRHWLPPHTFFSVRPGLYRAQMSLCHTGHPQVTTVIYGLLEQTNPTQGDMEQERGHSPIFLLTIWWHCSFYSVPLHNPQMWLSAMAIPSSQDQQWAHCIIQQVVPLCWENNHAALELEVSDSCQYFLCSHVELAVFYPREPAKKLIGMSLFLSALSFLTPWPR